MTKMERVRMTKLSEASRNKLKSVSTATVATALFKRGFRIQMIQDVHPLSPDQPTLVGFAYLLSSAVVHSSELVPALVAVSV